MPKRTWTDAHLGPSQGSSSASPPHAFNAVARKSIDDHDVHTRRASHLKGQREYSVDDHDETMSVSTKAYAGPENGPSLESVSNISRKIKACAACRKQKVRCLMDESGPPCRRCAEKDLACVLNKSLQTLINERLPSSDALVKDLETVHISVQTILRTLNLPSMPALQSLGPGAVPNEPAESGYLDEVAGPSRDNSPKISPEKDSDLPKVPIRSVYHLTKLSALRSPDAPDELTPPERQRRDSDTAHDLISRRLVSLDDAERLFRLYTERLDHYMYDVGARYSSLAILRRQSPILTAAILTVAAMHDPKGNSIYLTCERELRRLMTSSLFDRRVDRDHLRALCVASYWLNDTSWVLSGVATRRAAEFNIASHYKRLVEENSEDAADFVRVWYLIYICDQHLSTLYGRQCVTREDVAVHGWEAFIKASTVTTGDKRLASQVNLFIIIHNIRELFASDTDDPIAPVFLTQIRGFARQLDQWVSYWSATMPEYQENFGTFPRKGVLFHFHFAKLYLYSHVFRGLGKSPIPPHFQECAHGAITAATSILDMLISDSDVKAALVGLPCYVQSMIGFACMFLAKMASIHGDSLLERDVVVDLISRLKTVYATTPVGKWHLVNLMANGLDKILVMLRTAAAAPERKQGLDNGGTPLEQAGFSSCDQSTMRQVDMFMADLDPYFLMDTGFTFGPTEQIYPGQSGLGFEDPNRGFS